MSSYYEHPHNTYTNEEIFVISKFRIEFEPINKTISLLQENTTIEQTTSKDNYTTINISIIIDNEVHKNSFKIFKSSPYICIKSKHTITISTDNIYTNKCNVNNYYLCYDNNEIYITINNDNIDNITCMYIFCMDTSNIFRHRYWIYDLTRYLQISHYLINTYLNNFPRFINYNLILMELYYIDMNLIRMWINVSIYNYSFVKYCNIKVDEYIYISCNIYKTIINNMYYIYKIECVSYTIYGITIKLKHSNLYKHLTKLLTIFMEHTRKCCLDIPKDIDIQIGITDIKSDITQINICKYISTCNSLNLFRND